MMKLICLLILPFPLLLNGAEVAPVPNPEIFPPSALKADIWVDPPKNERNVQNALASLRDHYKPFLRSLPPKIHPREQQSLNGAWWHKVEIADCDDGVIPPCPDWYLPGVKEEDGSWESVEVPHWRWSTKRDPTQRFPWYPESKIVWYRKAFDADPPVPGNRVFLNFAGADWAVEVWLNGTKLGEHSRYWEPFRFDVTDLLREKDNKLAVRLIDGPAFGETICQWSLLPFSPADKLPGKKQEFIMGRKDTAAFNLGVSTSGGSGYGIHREVFLESVSDVHVSQILVRGYPFQEEAKVVVETDAGAEAAVELKISLLPENFAGESFTHVERVEVPKGKTRHEFPIKTPGARWWWPSEPHLYRCRVEVVANDSVADARDALFGFREARLVTAQEPELGLPEGMFLLNGQPVFLRGTNVVSNPNLAWYWGETDRLLDILLLTKVSNFNFVRTHQHIAFPEVLELMDRLGILSQQEQGTGMQKTKHNPSMEHLAKVVAPMAEVLYNHPGVVFFSFMNETHANMTKPVAAVLERDPERLIAPIAGAIFALDDPSHINNLLGQFHRYDTWYFGVQNIWETSEPRLPGRQVLLDFKDTNPRPPANFFPVMTPDRMMICGEYGGEAMDNYESFLNYPEHWGKPPALEEEKIWGFPVNGDFPLNTEWGMRGGKGRTFGDLIRSSQIHQVDLLTQATIGFRLSPKTLAGYFQFHFLELTPSNWPKSLLGYDLGPKPGFFAMAQLNQPVVPLYRLMDRGKQIHLFAANSLRADLPGSVLKWRIEAGEDEWSGEVTGDVPGLDAVQLGSIDLTILPSDCELFDLKLELRDPKGRLISEFEHEIYRNFEILDRAEREMEMRAIRAITWNKKNVALNRLVITEASPVSSPLPAAVDGDYRIPWMDDAGQMPKSIVVELAEPTALCGARVMWHGRETGGVSFEFSDNKRDWRPAEGEVREASEQWSGGNPPLRIQYLAFTGSGKYVRVTVRPHPENTSILPSEIELYSREK